MAGKKRCTWTSRREERLEALRMVRMVGRNALAINPLCLGKEA